MMRTRRLTESLFTHFKNQEAPMSKKIIAGLLAGFLLGAAGLSLAQSQTKVAAPFREAEFDIIFNEGISQLGVILDIGAEKGVVDKSGAWYSFKGERLGQGREGAKLFLK